MGVGTGAWHTHLIPLGTVTGEFIEALRGACGVMVQDAPGAKDLVVGEARVAFEGVSFEYSAGTPVLSDVNFTAEGGATIALVGATGSGAPLAPPPPPQGFPASVLTPRISTAMELYTSQQTLACLKCGTAALNLS